MIDINRFCGDNLGGVIEFTFIPSRDVLSIPTPIDGKVLEEIELKPYKQWYRGYGTLETMGYEEDTNSTKHGTLYSKKFISIVPKILPEYTNLFHEMRNENFIVVGRDSNNIKTIYGSIEEPLKFKNTKNTKVKIAERNEIAITFFCDGTKPSYAYCI